jgi:hypothetical protein
VGKFHHPDWDGSKDTPPDIETLLTEWSANQDLLPSIRPNGPFTEDDLKRLRRNLLGEIADWFHEIHASPSKVRDRTLAEFFKLVSSFENPAIISFNWDYELDRILCERRRRRDVYGFENQLKCPVLLKPHSSLNWYRSSPGRHIEEKLRETFGKIGSTREIQDIVFLTGVRRSLAAGVTSPG